MLRHKALIQCARIAFGFAGIYDEDEGQRIREAEAATDIQEKRSARVTASDILQIKSPEKSEVSDEVPNDKQIESEVEKENEIEAELI